MRSAVGRHFRYVTIRELTREDSVLYFPPEAFGPYRVLHQIGAGTLGPVFRAHDAKHDRLVAVKVFRSSLSIEDATSLVRAFEALVIRVPHEAAIAAPIAAGLDGTVVYLVTEHVVGESADEIRATLPLDLLHVVRIIEPIARAIDRSAERGVHHLRLHPRDALLAAEGPRITGLGVAEALTSVGLSLPPRAPYEPPDGPSDVYALAAIAYELLSGRRMTRDGWDELSAEDGPELRDAFAAALAGNVAARPKTAGEFAARLREASGKMAESLPSNEREEPERAAHNREPVPDALPVEDDEVLRAIHTQTSGPNVIADDFAGAEPTGEAVEDEGIDLDAFVEKAEEDRRARERTIPPPSFMTASPADADRAPRSSWPIILALIVAALVAGATGYVVVHRRVSKATAGTEPPPASATAETTVELSQATPPPAVPEPPSVQNTPAPPLESAPSKSEQIDVRHGRLLLRSTPAGATATVNGEVRGKTPLALRDLAFGSYTIHFERDGFTGLDRRVRLTPAQPSATVALALRRTSPAPSQDTRGSVLIESHPAGARVFVNGRMVGLTPLTVPGLPGGLATVRLEMDGYRTWTSSVRVSGTQARVAASLERLERR